MEGSGDGGEMVGRGIADARVSKACCRRTEVGFFLLLLFFTLLLFVGGCQRDGPRAEKCLCVVFRGDPRCYCTQGFKCEENKLTLFLAVNQITSSRPPAGQDWEL